MMTRMLCEPYLLDPGPDSVHVVWHTEHPGTARVVLVGEQVAELTAPQAVAAATGTAPTGAGWRRCEAETIRLRRTREDADSQVPGRRYDRVTNRPVYRHMVRVTGLRQGRTPYRVVWLDQHGHATVSQPYSLAPAVPAHRPVRLLLTSDHQLLPMVAANLQMVADTVGYALDGVLIAGDLVNVPDRASEWFDSGTGLAAFANLTGRAHHRIAGRTWRGAPIAQHSPLYPAIGNHEVMGRWSATAGLNAQFNDPAPGAWDITTYEQLFPYPRSVEAGPRWWSRTIGNVHVTALFVTHIWRSPATSGRGKYQEDAADVAHPQRWGHGQFIFAPVGRGSRQYRWLQRTLASAPARQARYRVVMFHHPGHGVGENVTPPYADPVPTVHRDPKTGAVTAVTYDYPLAGDHILRDLEPLFNQAGVNLVLNGHTHVWNRFRNPTGVHWLETSNVGNSFGAYHPMSGRSRPVPDHPDYRRQGDPGGLAPVVPTVAPLTAADGAPLPYLSSNDITAFSILDSGDGVVRSYRFDTRQPDMAAVLFDEFPLD